MIAQQRERELISRYVDGAVTDNERLVVEQLLETSQELRMYCDELKQLKSVLNAWTPESPSAAWDARVEQALQTQTAQVISPVRPRRWVWAWSLGGVSCATAALLVVVVMSRSRSPAPVSAQYASVPAPAIVREQLQPAQVSVPQAQERIAAVQDASVQNQMPLVGLARARSVAGGALLEESGLVISSGLPFHTEQYDRIYDNRFLAVADNPLSTFSIDVDTASYANVRRFLRNGQVPPEDAVRIEELVNYFTYDYPQPEGDEPFSITVDRGTCPWNPGHELVRIGLKGRVAPGPLPPSNLVFLIDVSGSMDEPNKLPLLKSALQRMVNQLTASERVAIVVYAGAAGLVLDSTPGDQKMTIWSAINQLQAGGSTAGGEGIRLAYETARKHFIKDGNNRVILATDGDFNIGVSSTAELVRLIEQERQAGVFLTVLGFGTGNYKDAMMEQLADKGDGNYYYIDTEREAQKVLEEELGSVLFTIAKDVKIQIEFNPAYVKTYRLIGYENRMLAKEDFNDDTKDAGELGAGHTVTALYELVPADSKEPVSSVDELTFRRAETVPSDDLVVVKLRYKAPQEDESKLIVKTIKGTGAAQAPAGDFQFAAAVAEFGMLLRHSEFKGSSSYDDVLTAASQALGQDPYGYRAEFIDIVKLAKQLDHRVDSDEKPGIQFKGQ